MVQPKCQAKDPSTCRFHGTQQKQLLKEAARTGDYTTYERIKKELNTPEDTIQNVEALYTKMSYTEKADFQKNYPKF